MFGIRPAILVNDLPAMLSGFRALDLTDLQGQFRCMNLSTQMSGVIVRKEDKVSC